MHIMHILDIMDIIVYQPTIHAIQPDQTMANQA
jgi:hypothetical protein